MIARLQILTQHNIMFFKGELFFILVMVHNQITLWTFLKAFYDWGRAPGVVRDCKLEGIWRADGEDLIIRKVWFL